MKKLILTLLSAATLLQLHADENPQPAPTKFWGDSNAYLQRQANVMFDLVDRQLDAVQPSAGADPTRLMTLANLDMLLHDTGNDNSPAALAFLNGRVEKTAARMNKPVQSGYELHKIYNAGFVARTPSASLAFDIVRGLCHDTPMIADTTIQKIADSCDAMFITHNHSDHGDPAVVEMFLQAGKPVIAVPEFMPDDNRLIHIRPAEGAHTDEPFVLPDGDSLRLMIFPGHQDDLMNNLYVITTPEGFTFANSGDQYQSGSEDMEWIPSITPLLPKVDIFMLNCWNTRIPAITAAFNPRYVVTAHENEMGHTIDHREAFWLTFQKFAPVSTPYVVMGWGECFVPEMTSSGK
ncbi:MAG: MBL fold metallo-hydrolase [Bacteroidales bacterium]|nr:MBL fold metallo-hydrolase [Bacteroidales bacterium]